jgi:hypothetical protein
MSEECMELQNIEYQTMLLNSNSKVKSNKEDTSNIDGFLEKEKKNNQNKPWSKLGKNQKIQKLTEYIQKITKKHNFSVDELEKLREYLIKCIDRKKLQRVKDVTYDVKTGKIKAIPSLIFDKTKRKFTLKKTDKNKSSLRSLAPKNKTKSLNKNKTKPKPKVRRKKNNKLTKEVTSKIDTT